METNQAFEQLQTIRTLMERSALYRRALAPILLLAGLVGVLASIVGYFLHLESSAAFGMFWLGTAAVVVILTFIIARRQAFQAGEAFWSSPTRRVGQALALPFIAGFFLGLFFIFALPQPPVVLVILWMFCYGCALHSAGFFVPSGVRLFGWIYAGFAILLSVLFAITSLKSSVDAHWLMGAFFGGMQIACGIYLRLTEKGNGVQ